MSKQSSYASQCHRAARRYLSLGWNAVALCPGDHVGVGRDHLYYCETPGKVPLNPWVGLQTQGQQAWFLDSEFSRHPNANVGVVLGPVSGLVGLDVDGEDGLQTLHKLCRGHMPATLQFSTSRGFRLLFSMPGTEETGPENWSAGGVELLTKGRVTVMPPSTHASGKRYGWRRGHGPDSGTLSPVPSWLGRIPRPGAPGGHASLKPKEHVATGQPILDGNRNAHLFRLACALRAYSATEAEIWHCLTLLNRRCEPPLAESEVARIVRSAMRYQP